jgi:hypothetical protein
MMELVVTGADVTIARHLQLRRTGCGRPIIINKEQTMMLGMALSTFTTFHVILSLIGIAAGLIAVFGMLNAQRLGTWNALFLAFTVATSVTGFMFPFKGFDPADGVGVLSLVVLAIAIVALYVYHLVGAWRLVYVVSAVVALYLNVFVGVVQSFEKIPSLHPLAPTGSEPPFKIAQGIVLLIFIALGILAAKKFHPPVQTRI